MQKKTVDIGRSVNACIVCRLSIGVDHSIVIGFGYRTVYSYWYSDQDDHENEFSY